MIKPSKSSALSELFFNPHVSALPKYNSGATLAAARSASHLEHIARLGSNENPHGCSPDVVRALIEAATDISRYSDPGCDVLRSMLGEHIGVDPAEIVVGNGSEEMIAAASRAFLAADATALTVVPTFGLHEIEPLAVGAKVAKVSMTPDFGFDVAGLEVALALEPNLFYLPSPWNPVGAALDESGLDRLVNAASSATMFVLDEAYREFTSPSIPDGIAALRRSGKPHIVLRTFSKAYGLAGLRVGYAICSDARVARVLALAKTPFNVNALAQVAAVAALADQSWMREKAGLIAIERQRVRAALQVLGLRVAPSEANFLFFDSGRNSAELATELLKRGVIVKPWLEPKYQTCIRASIGCPEENDQFLDALSAVLALPRHAGVAAVR